MEVDHSLDCHSIEKKAREKADVLDGYITPSLDHLGLSPAALDVPIIDLSRLNGDDPSRRAIVINDIRNACRRFGFFQIVNHRIPQEILDAVLSSAFKLFELSTEEKMKFSSNDVHKPVRYGTTLMLKDGVDRIPFWRSFFKHYSYPLNDWIQMWPTNPPDYRENMGKYVFEVRKLALELMGAITESLGLGKNYMRNKMEDGMHVIAINWYPSFPQPCQMLGLPEHSDYSCLTILLQSARGLEIFDAEDKIWKIVPEVQGALQVNVGDHLEVLSNGIYKSVNHRATLNAEKPRISIASLHSLGMDEKMKTAKELVNEDHPERYKESSFNDFLNYLSKNDIAEGKLSFINALRI
ncbi:Isopenicillin N synthase-like, Fe(2+) 2OG dioxygenase domain [Dillenia turbinata]|uniref:Isopenicillin N synthase-like, Fe(2+) 2OG dioxygenase domain n=1 Tax=Dillenia turbinata TaxID=194707 RepID=A0AAN8V1G0_9MAGN